MTEVESCVFAAGMPVAALMEKVGGLLARRVMALYPDRTTTMGILVGPGHNGGDALVVARELHIDGYRVAIYCPFSTLKALTQQHRSYAEWLGIELSDQLDAVAGCDVLVDGLFGFGLTRPLEGAIATAIDQINAWGKPVLSIDVPSGLHTDTGAVLNRAIRASRTFCLGLWKRAFLLDQALEVVGRAELIDIGLPLAAMQPVLAESGLRCITRAQAIAALPLPRAASTHKYQQGHLLLIAGSRDYGGAALLAAQAARASGVGMLSIAVPLSLKPIVTAHIPDALVIGCSETESGAIAHLPNSIDLTNYQVIACGPGLTVNAIPVVEQVLDSPGPLILDADGLNGLAQLGSVASLRHRSAPTILTPHPGEFKRLFPELAVQGDRLTMAQAAAQQSGAIVLLKGARVCIATPQGALWVNLDSTPALARGGSGDVLTGLLGGLLAQGLLRKTPVDAVVQAATWWHAQAGMMAAHERSELGVDASTLTSYLIPALTWNNVSS